MSHALLLRLFLSPSFFSVHVALQYLRTYADNIGITYYLTRRLKELDIQELREVWGFICHLLVTRPSNSRALECFVVGTSHKSTHIAMLTLWFMQAHLKDLAQSRHDSESFLICQRVLHQCHEIIFGDFSAQSAAPYSGLQLSMSLRRKVKPNVQSALIGMGMILAGTPALPILTDVMGEVAIEQGRIDDKHEDVRSLDQLDDIVRTVSTNSPGDSPDQDQDQDQDGSEPDQTSPQIGTTDSYSPPSRPRVSIIPMPGQLRSLSRRQTIAAQTSPALPLHLKDERKPRLSEDPFDQEDSRPPFPSASPFQSTPSFSMTKHPVKSYSLHTADLLQKYDLPSQIHLLRSHFCRSEIQFLLALENISNRLLVVPRPARVSALRAELTGLNHMLPAEVCMPMWCSSSDTLQSTRGIPEPHHRIVRIPPGESVVLNSAERAPYLLLIEILHTDLDFDPAKRSNREILKKIVIKEEERKGGSRELVSFKSVGASSARGMQRQASLSTTELESRTDNELELDTALDEADVIDEALPLTPVHPSTPEEEEEIDLVEQLYGSDNDLRVSSIVLSESIILPPPPKNKELDMMTWSRSSSVPQTPVAPGAPRIERMPSNNGSETNSRRPTAEGAIGGNPASTKVLSLDEYSERMRTAAVMLAQLNANLVREPITTINAPGAPPNPPETPSPLRWLPGTSWLSGSGSPADGNGSAQDSPVAGPSSSNAPLRMKLQYAEATAIRNRIMDEMLALEEERMDRMRENRIGEGILRLGDVDGNMRTAEDEGIIRRELSKADPSAVVFSEAWATKKSRIRQSSPYGHLANWDCVSVIVKTGGDLRQEQLAVQLIQEFEKIWKEENCPCWVRYFRILITGNSSGLVETITDAVSIHSIKKAEYARRLAEGRFGHVTLYAHFKSTYGDPSSAKFARAQRNFAKSLAGYSLVTYLLQIKDRHNGNILLDRDGHLIHIDFGFMLSNSPGNIGFEAAPFKLPLEYIAVLGGVDSEPFREFKKLFKEGFEAARKHCDRIVTLVELMQKDSTLPCFAALGEQTANQLRERFQQGLTHAAVEEHVQRLIDTSLGSNWTRLYDSYQYYSQSIL